VSLAIQVESVAKRYRIGRHPGAYLTLRESLAARARRQSEEAQATWALRDVSFEVAEGQAVGIVGANGAGKSTLLRVLARITQPTSGVSRTRGRVGSLLEVGTGFHSELSGRENVFLNGAILGMTRRELRRRFDEIVAFAGVERFLDTPLKRYSTGMRLRLAFAVAAHVDPEIMLVDEVLAVGDARFRERCLGKMRELGSEGRTVLFVSHDLGAVTRLCSRAIWLDGGSVHADGPSADVIGRYLADAMPAGVRTFGDDPSSDVAVLSAATLDERDEVVDAPPRDRPLTLSARFVVRRAAAPLTVSFVVRDDDGVVVLDEDWGTDTGAAIMPSELPVEYEARLTIPPVLPARGYRVDLWMGTPYETVLRREVLSFRLAPRPDDLDDSLRRKRVVQPPVTWRVERVGVRAARPEAAEA
jgi:ABC-2 type transport system ATP-binding protein/lipopolysaccharide transport system ATP-binding protein